MPTGNHRQAALTGDGILRCTAAKAVSAQMFSSIRMLRFQ
jgi:hypothetical protein